MAINELRGEKDLAHGILPDFQEDDDVMRFTLSTNGATKEAWLDSVNQGFNFTVNDSALAVIKKMKFNPTKELERKVVIIKSTFFDEKVKRPRSESEAHVSEEEVQSEASERGLVIPDLETATLIISAVKCIGFFRFNSKRHLTIMHQPIKVGNKSYRLSLCSGTCFLNAFEELPKKNKNHGKLRGFYSYAFVEKD